MPENCYLGSAAANGTAIRTPAFAGRAPFALAAVAWALSLTPSLFAGPASAAEEWTSVAPLGREIDLADPDSLGQPWSWHLLPDGLIYRSYLAGVKEPRFAGAWVHERKLGWIWDIALGGRVGVLRYGTASRLWPEGWQIDLEGAAFPRLDLEHDRDLVAADFRFGIPLTYGVGPWKSKLAY